MASALTIGAAPLALAYVVETPLHQAATAAAVAPVLWACARAGWWRRGMALLGLVFVVHSALAIGLSIGNAQAATALFPGGAQYWERQHTWITTGLDPEYEVRAWGPAHVQLALATTLYSFTSLGVLTLEQGFYEVDLMNYYNAQLWTISRSKWRGLVWGWHLWSILRGMGYVILTFEIVSLALQILTGRQICAWSERAARWASGAACLIADSLAKYLLLDVVRRQLYDNLL